MMFGIAPIKVIFISESGDVSYIDDVEPEDGVTDINDMPKTIIARPGLNESTCPKNNWKDSANGFCFPDSSGTIDLAAALKEDRASRKWWD